MQSYEMAYPRHALLPSRRSLSSIRFSSSSPSTTPTAAPPHLPSQYPSTTRSVPRSRSQIVFNGTPIHVVSQPHSSCTSPKPAPYSPAPRSPQLSSSPSPSPPCVHNMQLPPPPPLPLPPSFEQMHPQPNDAPEAPVSPLEPVDLLSDDDESSSVASSDDLSSNPPSPNNFFIHNGYRYDGDVFELRPPQERSIASRPERVLEHKPLLLANRQTFNRVYSEGTYNARPSSLRQPVARARRRQAHVEGVDDATQATRKVTRPPSVRPSAVQLPQPGNNFAECIAAVRQNATVNGDDKLKGLLAYSAVPVTRQSGTPPPAFLAPTTAAPAAPAAPISMVHERENLKPLAYMDKRGRSYTSFAANNSVYHTDVDEKVSASAVLRAPKALKSKSSKFGTGGNKGGWFREKEREKEKRPSFWKLLSR